MDPPQSIPLLGIFVNIEKKLKYFPNGVFYVHAARKKTHKSKTESFTLRQQSFRKSRNKDNIKASQAIERRRAMRDNLIDVLYAAGAGTQPPSLVVFTTGPSKDCSVILLHREFSLASLCRVRCSQWQINFIEPPRAPPP